MEILLNKEIKSLGITELDIAHMLKACGRNLLCKTYEPTLSEVEELVNQAVLEECLRKRTVVKWNQLINEFNELTKE